MPLARSIHPQGADLPLLATLFLLVGAELAAAHCILDGYNQFMSPVQSRLFASG